MKPLYTTIHEEKQKGWVIKLIQEMNVPFQFHFKYPSKIRTLPQNKLYWLWIGVVIKDQAGRPDEALKNQIHKLLKDNFIRFENEVVDGEEDNYAIIKSDRKTYTVFGRKEREEPSTTRLDKIEFIKYMRLIKDYFEDYDIKVFYESDENFSSLVAEYSQYT